MTLVDQAAQHGFPAKVRRIWALVRKETYQIGRDPSSIAIGVVLPVLLILLFGYGLSLDVRHVPVAVVLEDASPEARELAGVSFVVVNETFVKHYFSGSTAAVGRRVASGAGNHLTYMTIVGVTRDAKHRDLRKPAVATLFTPLRQATYAGQLYLYLRTAMPPEQTFAAVRQRMKQIDPALAINEMRTMDDQIDTTLSNERMIELLAISFGLLATMLAGVGLYGVLAYSTAQRTREIGIRIALGSSRLGVSRLVLADVLRLAGIGIVVAIPCSVLLGKLLRSQLFGVSAADPFTLGGVVLLIAVVALVAAILPAHRASTVDPTTALRTE